MLRRKPYAGPTPAPLRPDELARLRSWEWWMVRFYTAAMLLIAGTVFVIGFYGTEVWVRRGVVVAILGLVLVATWVQFRELCPRCSARIGRQTRLILPPKCRTCGVRFEV